MPTYNFVTDFGAPTDGVSDCGAATAAWLTQAVANPGSTLVFPAIGPPNKFNVGDHNTALLTTGAKGVTLQGTSGTELTGLRIGTNNLLPSSTSTHQSRIQSVYSGSSTVALVSAADASKYAVGQWIIVVGISIQYGNSYPPNYQRFEFHQITNISGSTISLNSPLRYSYASTWPTLSLGGSNSDGPGAILGFGGGDSPYSATAGSALWDDTITVNDIYCSGGFAMAGSRYANLNNLSADTICSPTIAERIIFTGGVLTGSQLEPDKLIEYIEYNGVDGSNANLQVQSPSIYNLVITGGTWFNIYGTARNTTISNTTLVTSGSSGTIQTGPSTYGRSDSLTISNITGLAHKESAGNLVCPGPSEWTHLGNGLFRISVSHAEIDGVYSRAVPGYALAMGRAPFNISPDSGSVVSFCVTNLYDDASFVYMQTDLGGDFPSRTYGGLAPDMLWHYSLVTYSGPAGFPDTSFAPNACLAATDGTSSPTPPPSPPRKVKIHGHGRSQNSWQFN